MAKKVLSSKKRLRLTQRRTPDKSAAAIKAKSITPVEKPILQREDKSFPIVGMGASAGGLEAYEQFFKQMPSESGMGFVLIPHLDPGHSSMMVDLIRRFTHMEVLEAEDGMEVEPDHVYVIPPNKDMAMGHAMLRLTQPERTRGVRMPIDFFLRSLAEDQGDKAIGIILSGTGSDGSLGLRAIHGAGGMIMVQDVDNAKYEGMPQSAVATGLADYVLPAGKMPEQLLAYVKKTYFKKERPISISAKAPTSLQKIKIILRTQTGHDFSSYKKSTIYRRVEKRMDVHNIEDLPHYIRYLQENSDEVQMLFKELLIGVTSFFRDHEAFGPQEKGPPPAAGGQARRLPDPGLGSRVRQRGRGLFPGHQLPGIHGGGEKGVQGADLRHGHRRGGDPSGPDWGLPGQHRHRCHPGAAETVFPQG